MSSLLAPLLQKGWLKNDLDDLIVWRLDFTTLLVRLRQKEVTFLGHKISGDGSRPDPKIVDGIREMRAVTKVKEVRRFLGMCGFYRKYVPIFSKIASPLTNLTLAKERFEWTDECQAAFDTLK